MVRSYQVDIVVSYDCLGFNLLCFEGDDCVWEQCYDDSDVAHAMGQRFLDGLYVKGYPIEELHDV